MDPLQKSEFVAAFINLIPILGGALIGILGGFVGTKYSHRLNSSSGKSTERRAKLETLITESYEIKVWFQKQTNYYFYGAEEIIEQSPMAKVEAISSMYFPELDSVVSALSVAENEYRKFLVEGGRLRLAAKTPTPPREHLENFNEVYLNFENAQSNVVKEGRKLMAQLLAP
jgi:hypothetical protein